LFPEDYAMSRESLVRMWVAEGFVLGKGKNTPEDVAEGNLMELIHRNMLEAFEYDELGRVNTCKMHDIMRELALSVVKEEKFGSANDYGEMIQMDKDVRRLSLCGWKANTIIGEMTCREWWHNLP
jgi:disease resistance protein RPM1